MTAASAAGLVIARGAQHDWRSGDTNVLVDAVGGFTPCLTKAEACNQISKIPLLQQIPAYLFRLLGLSNSGNVDALIWLNAVAVVGLALAVMLWAYRRSGPAHAVLAGLLVTCGMLLPYSAQSFAEPLAAAAFAGVALTALRKERASQWLLVASLIATISKETAAPFVLLLGLAALGLSNAGLPVLKAAVIRLTIGVAIGELLNVALDVARYGSPVNTSYLAETRAPAAMWLSNGAGMLVSPNAGIVWFWPGAAIGIAVLIWAAIRPGARGVAARRIRASAVAGLMVLVITVGSLADWWAPFGWYAWGPRLLMPVACGVLILALPLIERQGLRTTWLSRRWAIVLGVVCGLTTLPNVAVVFRTSTYTAQITGSWRIMPICAPGHTNRAQDIVNACNRLQTWSPANAPLIRSVQQASHLWLFWVTIGLAWLGIATALRFAYRAAAMPPQTRQPLEARDSEMR